MNVREGFVEVDGHRLAFLAVNEHLTRPDELPVVFIHGVLASVNCWRDAVPPAFKSDRAWYALSLPAHYPSTVPADFSPEQVDEQWFYRIMNGALEQLFGGRKAIVVGHSTGGFSALNLAINQSPNVAGIVSVAGFHQGKWGGVEGQLLTLAGLGRWAKPLFALNITIARHSKVVRKIFASLLAHDSRAFLRNPLGQQFLENISADTEGQNGAALFNLFNGITRLEIGHRLNEISMPCHVFAGTHDSVVPASQSLLLAANIPGAITTVFRDTGHMIYVEDSTTYDAALEGAVKDISDRSMHAAKAA